MQDLLSTEYIMERYQMKRQAAAKLMYNMPVIKIGKRIFVRERDLEAYEQGKTEYPIKTISAPNRAVKIERRRA